MEKRDSPLDLSSLKKALASLEAALAITRGERFSELGEDWRRTLIAGVVQNFEFVFELSWKMLKRQLERELPNPAALDLMSYREMIRTGYERGLIDDPEAWFDYRLLRNITSHAYSEKKASQVFSGVPPFIESVRFLLAALESRNAET